MSEIDWEQRYKDARFAYLSRIKSLTKQISAGKWTPEYRKLAEEIHTVGREHFYIDPRE